jgi:hypothetical protein
VPYGSIGVKNKPIGTVADSSGHFAVETLLPTAATDTVVISCVGFQPRRMVFAELRKQSEIKLMPQAQALAEVVVHSRPPKSVVLGHRSASLLTSFGFYTQSDTVPHARLGRDMGVLLKANHPTELQSFRSATHSVFMRDKIAQAWRKLGFNPNMYFTGLAHP